MSLTVGFIVVVLATLTIAGIVTEVFKRKG